jgi:FAD/FMN-containing dehydrogenase
MQALIDEHFSKGQELRMFWGSFGDTDISKQEIRSKYYDNEEQYAKLQELKAKVDPNDLFHTEFTVKLPSK